MKTYLGEVIMGAAVAVLVISTANAQTPRGSVSFRITKGDTYVNLFGPDWEQAYAQNKVTVMRGGHAVSSPDILVQDSIVTVTGDVELTSRAWSRVRVLLQRRADLQGRLASLTPKLIDDPGARQTAADCQLLLTSTPRFAAGLEFAEQEVAHLERLARNKPATVPVPPQMSAWWIIALGAAMIVTFISVTIWRRRKTVYPEGSARYREALKDVRAAFQHSVQL